MVIFGLFKRIHLNLAFPGAFQRILISPYLIRKTMNQIIDSFNIALSHQITESYQYFARSEMYPTHEEFIARKDIFIRWAYEIWKSMELFQMRLKISEWGKIVVVTHDKDVVARALKLLIWWIRAKNEGGLT